MEASKINLLFVDDEDRFLTSMSKRIRQRGFHVVAVNRGEKAVDAARTHFMDIALIDLKSPEARQDVLTTLKQEHPWMEIVMVTGQDGIDSVVAAIRGGAYACLQKPCDLEQVVDALNGAYQKRMTNRGQVESTLIKELMRKVKYGYFLDAPPRHLM